MVDQARYVTLEEGKVERARKLAPVAWGGLLLALVGGGQTLYRLLVNISTLGDTEGGNASDAFIATGISLVAVLMALALLLGWGRWLRKKGNPDGLAILITMSIVLLIVAFSAVLTPEFYQV